MTLRVKPVPKALHTTTRAPRRILLSISPALQTSTGLHGRGVQSMADPETFDEVKPFLAHKHRIQSMANFRPSDEVKPFVVHKVDIDVSARGRDFFLATPNTVAPHQQSYRCSSERVNNLMCVSRLIREEAEEVLYGRFIFCFQYGLYQGAASRFISEISTKALSHLSTMPFVLRFDKAAPNYWRTRKENSPIMSRGFGGLRMVLFEIQVSREASKTMSTEAKDGVVEKLLTFARPFIERPAIKLRWVGIDLGGTLAGLCQDEFAKGDHCC